MPESAGTANEAVAEGFNATSGRGRVRTGGGVPGRVDYRFRLRNDDGVFLVEQPAYFDLDDAGLIARMNVACAGFRPFEATPA